MHVQFVDVRRRFLWHVTSVFECFVRSGVHVTKRLGTLLKRNKTHIKDKKP